MSLLHPRHSHQDEDTLGIDGVSMDEAVAAALAAEPLFRGCIYSVEDVLRLIVKANRPLTPGQIAAGLQIARTTIAAPLGRAVRAGLLERSGTGGWVKYHPTPEGLELVNNWGYKYQ